MDDEDAASWFGATAAAAGGGRKEGEAVPNRGFYSYIRIARSEQGVIYKIPGSQMKIIRSRLITTIRIRGLFVTIWVYMLIAAIQMRGLDENVQGLFASKHSAAAAPPVTPGSLATVRPALPSRDAG